MASIRKRAWKTAKGEARIAWCIDFTDANGVRQRRHFKTKHQANDFRVEIEGQLRAETVDPFEADTYRCPNILREKWTEEFDSLIARGIVKVTRRGRYLIHAAFEAEVKEEIYPFPDPRPFPDEMPPQL